MEPKGVPVSGGIGVLHRIKDGKHHYEVDTVIDDTKGKTTFFMRKGDHLSMINGFETQDLTPEAFAKMLSKGSPMLTVHHPGVSQGEAKGQREKDDQKTKKGFYPVSKENTVLTIFPKMVTSPDLQLSTDQGGGDDLQMEEDWMQGEGQQESGVLLVRMVGTTVSVLRGRGGAHDDTCKDCGGTGCMLEDFVLVPDRAEVTQGPKFENSSAKDIQSIEYLKHESFLSYTNEKPDLKPMSENMTIYFYESGGNAKDPEYKGQPVVLNFTKTKKFLKCEGTKTDAMPTLIVVERGNVEDLRFIPCDNAELLSFVFYMTGKESGERCFESARFDGWFVHAAPSDEVDVTCQKQTFKSETGSRPTSLKEDSLYFKIHCFPK